MKTLFTFVWVLGLFANASSSFAQEAPAENVDAAPKLRCRVHSLYLKFEQYFEVENRGEYKQEAYYAKDDDTEERLWVVRWSDSECEDSSELKFREEDYKALLSGEKTNVYARLTHDESDMLLSAEVTCEISAK